MIKNFSKSSHSSKKVILFLSKLTSRSHIKIDDRQSRELGSSRSSKLDFANTKKVLSFFSRLHWGGFSRKRGPATFKWHWNFGMEMANIFRENKYLLLLAQAHNISIKLGSHFFSIFSWTEPTLIIDNWRSASSTAIHTQSYYSFWNQGSFCLLYSCIEWRACQKTWQHLMHPLPLWKCSRRRTIRSNDPRGKYFYGTCRRRK